MCCTRRTWALFVAAVNILANIIVVISCIWLLVRLQSVKAENANQQEALDISRIVFIILIVLCSIMTVISGFLLMGIVKRRHKLMIPWMAISGIGFVVNCANLVFKFFGALFGGVPLSYVFAALFVGLCGIAISALIIWLIYTVYRDIRKENIETSGRELIGSNMNYENNYKI